MDSDTSLSPPRSNHPSWPQVLTVVVAAMILTAVATLWVATTYVFPPEFTPVSLDSQEEKTLAFKIENLNNTAAIAPHSALAGRQDSGQLQPMPYSEVGALRDVYFTERELNALLANNTDLARQVAIDLSENLISANLRIPVAEDFPVLGGKILRAKTGVEFAYQNERPIVKLKGVTMMGVPIPNAWLGGLKNIDLVQEFGSGKGFWKTFADGIAAVNVQEGKLMVRLKE